MKYNLYDVNGKLRPLKDIFKDLDDRLSNDMSDKNKIDIANSLSCNIDIKSYITLLANSIKNREAHK